jgi:DNA-directed RNA polymerase subunit RPC12/RpoP
MMRDTECFPAADVVPVRHGRWQITDAYPHNVYCSECHKRFAQTHWAVWEDGSLPRSYCPDCGAKMQGDANE